MREVRRANPPQPAILDADAIPVELRHHCVHAIRVPRQHDVGQQCVSSRDCRHLLPPAATLRGHLAAMNGALQLMHRLAPVEQGVYLAPIVRDGQVVAQKQRSQQAPKVFCSAVQRVADRC